METTAGVSWSQGLSWKKSGNRVDDDVELASQAFGCPSGGSLKGVWIESVEQARCESMRLLPT